MSVSSVSIPNSPRQPGGADDGWQQFAQLVRAVNAGDLPAAQTAHAKFTESTAGDVARANPDGRLAKVLSKVGDALQSGDITQAQQALSLIRTRATDAAQPTVQAPSISPADPNAPGGKLDLKV